MPQQYHFITKWQIKAPVEKVYNAIYESNDWSNWWKSVLSVKDIVSGKERGIGDIKEYKWGTPLGYKLSFNMELTQREDNKLLAGEAKGELEGTGIWYFSMKDYITYVEYHWTVATTKEWMNLLSFMLKPAFKYNHDAVMRSGAIGLAKKLNAELVGC